MSYENAPATKMLATYCACCARPLLDAESVEVGMGPVCRKTHGFARAEHEPDWDAVLAATDGFVAMADVLGPKFAPGATKGDLAGMLRAMETAWRLGGLETRRVANLLVHRIACEQTGEGVNAMTNALRALGFRRLGDRIASRLATIVVEEEDGTLVVKTPYNPTFVQMFAAARREIGNDAYWDAKRKRNIIPARAKRALFELLKAGFPGATLSGPKGLTTLPAHR